MPCAVRSSSIGAPADSMSLERFRFVPVLPRTGLAVFLAEQSLRSPCVVTWVLRLSGNSRLLISD